MTHELIEIVAQAQAWQQQGQRMVLATVVALDGSSYRKPGVRMLMAENGQRCGAVSGGCVENEVFRRAQPVFESGRPKVMAYDGRYRLGCEGVLYILLEPFEVSTDFLSAFANNVHARIPFQLHSWFRKQDESTGAFGSVIAFADQQTFTFSSTATAPDTDALTVFSQDFSPNFKLLILGAEHDAVKLCSMASLLGWDVMVVGSIRDPKTLADFPGAKTVLAETPETLPLDSVDADTAIVMMTHNYALDLKYLLRLQHSTPAYLGIVGSTARRERLQEQLFEHAPGTAEALMERIHSPAGLNLGAETPAEIALAILAEILAVTRQREAFSLKTLMGHIHS